MYNHIDIAKAILNESGSEINAQAHIDREVSAYFEGASPFNLEATAADIKDMSTSESHYKNAIAKFRTRLGRAVKKIDEDKRASMKEKDGSFYFTLKDAKQATDAEKDQQTAFNEWKKVQSPENAKAMFEAMIAYAEEQAHKRLAEHDKIESILAAEKAALANGIEDLQSILKAAA